MVNFDDISKILLLALMDISDMEDVPLAKRKELMFDIKAIVDKIEKRDLYSPEWRILP
jgi:hypothetical protein